MYYICLQKNVPFFPIGRAIVDFMMSADLDEYEVHREVMAFLEKKDPEKKNNKYGFFLWRKHTFQAIAGETMYHLSWFDRKCLSWYLIRVAIRGPAEVVGNVRSFWSKELLDDISYMEQELAMESSFYDFDLLDQNKTLAFTKILHSAIECPTLYQDYQFAHVATTEDGSSVEFIFN